MKKVLVTGGCGFLGHHVVEHLLKITDFEIVILDSLSYAGNLNRLTDIDIWEKEKKRVKIVWHDLRSPISKTTDSIVGKVDFIFHLAAETHVDRSLENSIPFVQTNVIGTANLLEWLRGKDFEKCIVFSTDEVFGPAPEEVSFKEDDRLRPSNPYAASKVGEEAIAFSFAHAFEMPILIVRCMNLFGERQHPEKFIPKIVRSLLSYEKVILHGRNKDYVSSRCWIHCRNVADALLFLLRKGEREEFYHVVGEEKTVYEIANIINNIIYGEDISDDQIEFVDFHSCRPGHDLRYALDGSKMKELGWTPILNVEESLEKTIRWMIKRENLHWLHL